MAKRMLPILFLVGLVIWGIYDYTQKQSASQDDTIEKKEGEKDKGEPEKEVTTGIDQGNLAPDFSLDTMDGKSVQLSDFRGKNVIINFWATWCPPCRAEMPEMEEYYEQHKDDDFTILAVNLTATEKNKKNIKDFVKEFEVSFPVVLDENNMVAETYQVTGYPTSYFIDKDGIIRYKVVGAMNQEIIDRQVKLMK